MKQFTMCWWRTIAMKKDWRLFLKCWILNINFSKLTSRNWIFSYKISSKSLILRVASKEWLLKFWWISHRNLPLLSERTKNICRASWRWSLCIWSTLNRMLQINGNALLRATMMIWRMTMIFKPPDLEWGLLTGSSMLLVIRRFYPFCLKVLKIFFPILIGDINIQL